MTPMHGVLQILLDERFLVYSSRERRVSIRLRVPRQHWSAGHHTTDWPLLSDPHWSSPSQVRRRPCWTGGYRENWDHQGSNDFFSEDVPCQAYCSEYRCVIHSPPINLETVKYFNDSQLKLLNFQTPLSRRAWTDTNNKLLIDNWHHFKLF